MRGAVTQIHALGSFLNAAAVAATYVTESVCAELGQKSGPTFVVEMAYQLRNDVLESLLLRNAQCRQIKEAAMRTVDRYIPAHCTQLSHYVRL